MRRLYSIDIMRAAAIILMVQVHFVGNLSPREPSSKILYDLSIFFGGFAAPTFTFLVGMSLWLWLNKQQTNDTDQSAARRFIIKRGLLIVLFGSIFAVIMWTPVEIFNWDILPMIGISTIILYAVRKVPTKYLIALSVLISLIAPPLRQLTNYSHHWAYGEYVYDFTLLDILLGVTLQGYFPLLPWLVFPIIGFCLGRAITPTGHSSTNLDRSIPILGIILVIIAAVGALSHQFSPIGSGWYLSPISFYPASTTYVLGVLGSILMAFWFLHRRYDTGEAPTSQFIHLYSKFSLTTYVLHHAVHLWPIYLLAAWNDKDIWYYYQDAISTPLALGLTIVFIAVFFSFLKFLNSRAHLSLEGLLRNLSKA